MIDSGTFTLFLKGARIGDERFVIRERQGATSGPIYRSGAELNLKVDGRTMRIGVALEATGTHARPRRYEAKINGSATTTIVGTVVGDRFNLDARSPSGEEMKELLVRGRTIVLDRHIAHQYFFLTRLLGSDTASATSVIIPRDMRQENATVVDRGMETVQLDDRQIEMRHITLTTEAGTMHDVWLDGDQLMRVEIPDQEFVAVRSGAEAQPTNRPRGSL